MKKLLVLVLVAPLALVGCGQVKSSQDPLSPNIQVDGESYSCTNPTSGTVFLTSDIKECEKYVSAYRCELDANWFISVADEAECEVKQKENVAKKNAEFNLDATREDYRNALNNLEQKTR